MTTFNPLVSIVIPVYNGSNYLREAIDSALAQTYKNIEIIVVNDGSTDNTEEIAKSYGNKIRYFKKENGGVSTALNLGIKEMKGEYFSWLSHDDMYYPDKIEVQINELRKLNEKEREKTIIYGNYSLVDEKGSLIDKYSIESDYDTEKLNIPIYAIFNCLIHGCTLLIPKKCFIETGLFNTKLKIVQDYEMWFRMFPKYYLLFKKNFFVKFRSHSSQGSNTIKSNEADNLWKYFISTVDNKNKIESFGSLEKFYLDVYRFANQSNFIETKKILKKQMNNLGFSENIIFEKYLLVKHRIINKLRRKFIQYFVSN